MVKFWKMTHQAFGPRCTRSAWRLQPAWAGTTPGPATSSPATKRSSTMQGDKKRIQHCFIVNIAFELFCIPHTYTMLKRILCVLFVLTSFLDHKVHICLRKQLEE